MTANATKRLAKVMLLLAAMVAFTLLNHYVPLIVQPLVAPLIALAAIVAGYGALDRLIAEQHGFLSRLVGALDAAAQTTSGELQQLRQEVNQQSQSAGVKSVGFQVTPEGGATAAAGRKSTARTARAAAARAVLAKPRAQ
jgi:hypothetical protein